jgi:hypothetical protein
MRLYIVAGSHPSYAVEAALRLKGLPYDRVVPPIGDARPPLLDVHRPAGLLDVGHELVGLLAVDALLDRLGGLVHERLRLL